jgi:hypothetical protein
MVLSVNEVHAVFKKKKKKKKGNSPVVFLMLTLAQINNMSAGINEVALKATI